VSVGVIEEDEVASISRGMLRERVDVKVNRLVTEYDHVLICGPVFPHEVVGFSGGNKYFFPGVSGKEVIDLSHWLGALITSYEIIGSLGVTPVRALINRAASLIPTPRSALCFVVAPASNALHGLYAGPAEEAWAAAAQLSAQVHVRYVDRQYSTVVSVIPQMYDEIWVAAKGMYKLEPVVADHGEIIIYAPHVRHVSRVHGEVLKKVGYHSRDYFLAHWDEFRDLPWGVLAHSTHLTGAGTFDPETREERKRIRVTLATGIPEEECRALGLGYLDPATVDVADYADREDEGVLLVPKAGEMLYRLTDPREP
jgi:nickel-dependent lactate racemase